MTYHCDKLCSCEPLRNALDEPLDPDGCTCIECQAYDAVRDPAKLAKLMAMALRARDVHVFESTTLTIFVNEPWPCIVLEDERSAFGLSKACDVITCRAILGRVMSTPADESSRDDCLRIVRGAQ